MSVGERRLVLEKSPWERWPPFPSNHPWKCSPSYHLPSRFLLYYRIRDLRKEPRSRNKGGVRDEETLILINCLIFLRDVRDALLPAGLVYISLDHTAKMRYPFVTLNSQFLISYLSNIHCFLLGYLYITWKIKVTRHYFLFQARCLPPGK